MADPNNIPQEAQQLKEEINASKSDSEAKEKPDMASPDFDKEYEIAQQNENGAGSQLSDPNPVNRKGAEAGGGQALSQNKGKVDSVDSPGDSDHNDYLDMAKDLTEKVKSNK